MVKEYVDHERGQAGQAPISTLTMYRNTPQPDWWPSGVPVSSPLCGCTIKRVAAWCFLGGCAAGWFGGGGWWPRGTRGARSANSCSKCPLWQRHWPGPPTLPPCPWVFAVVFQGFRNQGCVHPHLRRRPHSAGRHPRRPTGVTWRPAPTFLSAQFMSASVCFCFCAVSYLYRNPVSLPCKPASP